MEKRRTPSSSMISMIVVGSIETPKFKFEIEIETSFQMQRSHKILVFVIAVVRTIYDDGTDRSVTID